MDTNNEQASMPKRVLQSLGLVLMICSDKLLVIITGRAMLYFRLAE